MASRITYSIDEILALFTESPSLIDTSKYGHLYSQEQQIPKKDYIFPKRIEGFPDRKRAKAAKSSDQSTNPENLNSSINSKNTNLKSPAFSGVVSFSPTPISKVVSLQDALNNSEQIPVQQPTNPVQVVFTPNQQPVMVPPQTNQPQQAQPQFIPMQTPNYGFQPQQVVQGQTYPAVGFAYAYGQPYQVMPPGFNPQFQAQYGFNPQFQPQYGFNPQFQPQGHPQPQPQSQPQQRQVQIPVEEPKLAAQKMNYQQQIFQPQQISSFQPQAAAYQYQNFQQQPQPVPAQNYQPAQISQPPQSPVLVVEEETDPEPEEEEIVETKFTPIDLNKSPELPPGYVYTESKPKPAAKPQSIQQKPEPIEPNWANQKPSQNQPAVSIDAELEKKGKQTKKIIHQNKPNQNEQIMTFQELQSSYNQPTQCPWNSAEKPKASATSIDAELSNKPAKQGMKPVKKGKKEIINVTNIPDKSEIRKPAPAPDWSAKPQPKSVIDDLFAEESSKSNTASTKAPIKKKGKKTVLHDDLNVLNKATAASNPYMDSDSDDDYASKRPAPKKKGPSFDQIFNEEKSRTSPALFGDSYYSEEAEPSKAAQSKKKKGKKTVLDLASSTKASTAAWGAGTGSKVTAKKPVDLNEIMSKETMSKMAAIQAEESKETSGYQPAQKKKKGKKQVFELTQPQQKSAASNRYIISSDDDDDYVPASSKNSGPSPFELIQIEEENKQRKETSTRGTGFSSNTNKSLAPRKQVSNRFDELMADEEEKARNQSLYAPNVMEEAEFIQRSTFNPAQRNQNQYQRKNNNKKQPVVENDDNFWGTSAPSNQYGANNNNNFPDLGEEVFSNQSSRPVAKRNMACEYLQKLIQSKGGDVDMEFVSEIYKKKSSELVTIISTVVSTNAVAKEIESTYHRRYPNPK